MTGQQPLFDLGLGTTKFRRRAKPAAAQPSAPPAPPSPASERPATRAEASGAEPADTQMVLVARIDRLRGSLTKVVAELRAVEKRTRRGGTSPEDAAEMARLRSDETRLHREIAALRADLERVRRAAGG